MLAKVSAKLIVGNRERDQLADLGHGLGHRVSLVRPPPLLKRQKQTDSLAGWSLWKDALIQLSEHT
jgi:hypothetical protein